MGRDHGLGAHPRVPVGILANQGVLFSESANKGAQFIQPKIVGCAPSILNITGFMVGTEYDRGASKTARR